MATVLKTRDERLPRWPTGDEIRAERRNRIRLGSLEATDDVTYYIHRYNRILAGVSPKYLTPLDFQVGCYFEWCLADLKACEECGGVCRTFQGCNQYMDFDRKAYDIAVRRYEKEGGTLPKPRFVVRACPGAKERVRELAEFYKAVTYR
jgi:hypothetical protein